MRSLNQRAGRALCLFYGILALMNVEWEWITTTGSALLMIFLTGLGLYLSLLLLTRLTGLRSFAKMSSFDFAITVAFGSLLATVIVSRQPPLLQGVAALVVLFVIQYTVSRLRLRSSALAALVDNKPLLLMVGSEILDDNLKEGRMTRADLNSKLRLAGISHRDQVLAVVMETTGDVSVIKGAMGETQLDMDLFEGVRDAERLYRQMGQFSGTEDGNSG